MLNQSRRTFIKGAVYTSTLAATGVTGLCTLAKADSHAEPSVTENIVGAALPTCEINIPQNQMIGTAVMTLNNHTNDSITLHSITPMNMQHSNEYLSVKIDKLAPHANHGEVSLAPGETLSFLVSAISCDNCGNANNQNLFIPRQLHTMLNVSSDHPEFNGTMTITVNEVA